MSPEHRLAVEIMFYELKMSPHEIAASEFDNAHSLLDIELTLGIDRIGTHSSRNRIITFEGKSRTLTEWEKITGITRTTIHSRLKKGMSIEEALTMPVKRRIDNRKAA